MFEEERKYGAGPGFAVPDLTPCLPPGEQVVELAPVRRMRAGCRRLRGDLRTSAPLLDRAWAGRLLDELEKAPAADRYLSLVDDLVVAAQAWLSIARSDPDDHLLAVTAGRLVERERAQVRRVRAELAKAWRAATRPRLTAWLP